MSVSLLAIVVFPAPIKPETIMQVPINDTKNPSLLALNMARAEEGSPHLQSCGVLEALSGPLWHWLSVRVDL